MNKASRLHLLLIALMMVSPVVASESRLIVPGISVGPITAETSEADLVAQMPPAQIKRVLHGLGEGMAQCGTEVFSGTPDVVVVLWSNDGVEYELGNEMDLTSCKEREDLGGAASVIIGNAAGGWHTADGIRIGMTVSDLAKLIGRPVSVSVCPCDYGGFIEAPEMPLATGLTVWAEYPLNADFAYADVIDIMADYMLSSSDIDISDQKEFWLSRMVVDVSD